jgi:putative endonuclease
MAQQRPSTGALGEAAAARHYRDRGYRVLARNWRCSIGELDLVLTRADTLVFCEVKARRGSGFGAGWEAVTARKRQKLRSLGQTFLLTQRLSPGAVRFDVASVLLGSGRSAQVEVFEDAF